MRRPPRVYISGLISNGGRIKDPFVLAKNVNAVRKTRDALWIAGFQVFCPHTNDEGVNSKGVDYKLLLQYDYFQITFHDCIYMMRGWEKSEGSRNERIHAIRCGLTVLYSLREARRFLKRWGSL